MSKKKSKVLIKGTRTQGKNYWPESLIEIRPSEIRDWVLHREDSRWRRMALSVLDFMDVLIVNPKIDREYKIRLLAGVRLGVQVLCHPHHSSSSGNHMILDVLDERMGELGFTMPECDVKWATK